MHADKIHVATRKVNLRYFVIIPESKLEQKWISSTVKFIFPLSLVLVEAI